MTDQILGDVDNGRIRPVTIGAYTGPAGIQRVTGEIQVAFIWKGQPTQSLPIDVVVSGERMRAVSRIKSDIADMHIFVCEYPD
jgi:hypothetical protein